VHVPVIEELRLPARLSELTRFPHGLVIVTGPTGSGKSTTLAALIEDLNRRAAKHVITIEDPIEYEYRSERCLIHQREVGRHVDGFAAGLRAALRESPDVILVGEMRDRETAAAALTAAETGHLVLSTLHTGSAANAIDRIIDLFPGARQQQARLQLAHSLRAVLMQVLVPSSRGEPDRVPAYELLLVNGAISNQIREGKIHQIPDMILTGRNEGMVPLVRSLARLVQNGDVSFESAAALVDDPGQLREIVRLGGS
jgi:twitching motility protein PilT